MNRLPYLPSKIFPYIIVATVYALYVMVFAIYHERAGEGIASLALIPVTVASWYFGIRGGALTAIFSTLANIVLRTFTGYSYLESITNPSMIVGTFALIFVALIIGRLGTVTRERREAIIRLEKLEKQHLAYTGFLEFLNQITGITLESDELESTLGILVEQIAKLFKADDCFFARWDETNAVTIPTTAYGSLSDIYPQMHFEPGERTLTASIMEAEHPIAISDLKNSSFVSPKFASLFPSTSMLGLPLIVQSRKLGVLILGYNKSRSFDPEEISRAKISAEQIALVLSKLQLLEEAHKQVAELTALHDVALASIEADSEDQLIEHVTNIIGQNLFSDNFGIMLLDENSEILHAHPSYRFLSPEELHMVDIPLGEGITGLVAKIGVPRRIRNVKRVESYLDVDKRTVSELCVPIKLRERVLGVINAESMKEDAFTVDDERLLVTLAGQLATAIEQLRKAENERKWLGQLAHSNELIYSLAHITTHIEKALSPDGIVQALGIELNKINLTCLMTFYDGHRKLFTINYTSIGLEVLAPLEKGIGFSLIEQTFSLDEMNSVLNGQSLSQPVVVSDVEEEIQILFTRKRKVGISMILKQAGIDTDVELMRLPLMFEENLLGVLWVWGEGITKADLPIMSIFAKQIGISLERARLFQEVQSLALTDPLTGLHNRRSFFQLGRVEFSRAHRMERPLSCMMLDLDHFKQINDNYGHLLGDQILQEFAKRCKDSVREMDLVGRYGGEELIILLPETDLITALRVAERTCTLIAKAPMKVPGQEINVMVSIGIAAKNENSVDLETLIARADQAMYIAKHQGRNRVSVSK